MSIRSIILLSVALLSASCGGGDRHLPSSNPPEYDPKKVYTPPPAPPIASATVTKPAEFERLKAQLESLEANQKAKGEGKKIPFDPSLLPSFKGVTNPCEALSRLAPGLGSAQLFAGNEGAALKKALGPDADGIARRMDEQVAESLKQSLGPTAADCPISVRPQKKSDLSRPARLVLAHATSTQPLLLAQTTVPETSQDDYYVAPPQPHREEAPPDWVGWKTTDTMNRIGRDNRPTKGIREHYEMVIAPMAKRCPDPAGMVEGTFEWSIGMYRAITNPEGTVVVFHRRLVRATLKGEVDDDAKVKQVKYDVTVTLQHIGTELAPSSRTYGSSGHFTLDQRNMGIPQELKIITVSGFSEGKADLKDAQLLGTLTALMAWFSGPVYLFAQDEWSSANTCVEITFNPPTKTKKFEPNASTPVKTELRTKKGQAIVPAKFKEAEELPRERNGTVSPREDKSEPSRPATFTYQAPGTRVRHSGFKIGAVSRAGVAAALPGEWELADSGLRLRFSQRIMADPQSLKAKGGWAQFDGAVQFEILLQPQPHAEGLFLGEINLVRPMVVRHVKYGTCGSASRSEHWLVTAHVNPKSESMDIRFGFTTSNEQGSWTCGGPREELHDDLFEILESVSMPARTGTKQDFNARNLEFLEWLSVEVMEGIDEQSR